MLENHVNYIALTLDYDEVADSEIIRTAGLLLPTLIKNIYGDEIHCESEVKVSEDGKTVTAYIEKDNLNKIIKEVKELWG